MPPHRQHRRHLVVACFGFIARGAACALNRASSRLPYPPLTRPQQTSSTSLSPAAWCGPKKKEATSVATPVVVVQIENCCAAVAECLLSCRAQDCRTAAAVPIFVASIFVGSNDIWLINATLVLQPKRTEIMSCQRIYIINNITKNKYEKQQSFGTDCKIPLPLYLPTNIGQYYSAHILWTFIAYANDNKLKLHLVYWTNI